MIFDWMMEPGSREEGQSMGMNKIVREIKQEYSQLSITIKDRKE
jgi:hypothetical protein